jgi:hypothetical protein
MERQTLWCRWSCYPLFELIAMVFFVLFLYYRTEWVKGLGVPLYEMAKECKNVCTTVYLSRHLTHYANCRPVNLPHPQQRFNFPFPSRLRDVRESQRRIGPQHTLSLSADGSKFTDPEKCRGEKV